MNYKAHIAVNTRVLQPHLLQGIGRFTLEVLKRLTIEHPEIRFSFFFDRPFDSSFIFSSNVYGYHLPPPARHPILWNIWFHYVLPWKIRQIKANLFFSPEFYLTTASKIPQIPVFHDIAFEHFPEDIDSWAASYCQKYAIRYARKAQHILTVSEFSKKDILEHYQLTHKPISVVYNGVSQYFHPSPYHDHPTIRHQYAEGKDYFHFVGTLQPRKNIPILLQSFDLFKRQVPSEVKLLLVGRKGWKNHQMKEAYDSMEYKKDVIFTGFVSDQELARIHSASLGLCFVPYFEGFGIPLLEAMQCETAIICSNNSALPEVVGNAAILVDPFKIEKIAEAMRMLYLDPTKRESLIENGKIQRERFSWDITAQKVWSVLSSCLSLSS